MVCLPPSSHHLVSFDVQESKLLHVYVQTTRLNQSVLCLFPLEHPAWQKNHPSLTVAKKKKQIPYSTFDLGAMRVSCYVFGYKPAGCLTQPLSWHQKWAWHWITILQFHAPPILTAPECCHGHGGPRWENPKGGTSLHGSTEDLVVCLAPSSHQLVILDVHESKLLHVGIRTIV